MAKKISIIDYVDYFHDGTIVDIVQKEDNLSFLMESGYIDPDEINDPSLLSNANTLKGKLNLKKIRKIKVNNKECKNSFVMTYDEGDVLELDIFDNTAVFLIEWTNYPPKLRSKDLIELIITADEIYWENLPHISI